MIARAALSLLLAVFAAGCSAAAERGYYTPVGVARASRLQAWSFADDDSAFEIACQGFYVNRVGGLRVRTMHLQLQATCSRSEPLVLPLSDLRLDLVWEREARTIPLGMPEAWEGRVRRHAELVVPGWSRRSFDLFFDHPDAELPPPDQVRVRWRHRAGDAWSRGDAFFVRLAPGDPALPPDDAALDVAFGVLGGFYMPGRSDLGTRKLQPSGEQRAHYVFHAPDGWF